ncbi:hypothetical protein [Streptomyces sp. CB03911]|uniref:hypothetical protein n=1 Tax=Streptomycetaceae TaxID=2062 RepID=UPI000938D523|nr:hypothetical protein [Streptomyces sp. CB03911]
MPGRAEWVRTRLTAKAALRWATGEPGHEILTAADGAPVLRPGPAAAAVSLAHTRELAVCAVTRGGPAGWLGVDVEPVDARNDILLRRLLGPGEQPPACPEPAPGLLATVLVACKEAALKAYRRPSPSLRDYRLHQHPDGRLGVRFTGGPGPGLRLRWTCRDGLVTALCTAGDEPPPQYRTVGADEVLTALGVPRPGRT